MSDYSNELVELSVAMPEIFLKDLNLSDTLIFLQKLSSSTLWRLYDGLYKDAKRFYPQDPIQAAIQWYRISINDILQYRNQ